MVVIARDNTAEDWEDPFMVGSLPKQLGAVRKGSTMIMMLGTYHSGQLGAETRKMAGPAPFLEH